MLIEKNGQCINLDNVFRFYKSTNISGISNQIMFIGINGKSYTELYFKDESERDKAYDIITRSCDIFLTKKEEE